MLCEKAYREVLIDKTVGKNFGHSNEDVTSGRAGLFLDGARMHMHNR